MHITITAIELRHWWQYFPLTYRALHIVRQMRRCKGYKSMKNTGFGYWHYTLSAWDSLEDLRAFAQSGVHLEAMKNTAALAVSVWTHTYQSEQLPTWKEAKKLLFAEGRALRY